LAHANYKVRKTAKSAKEPSRKNSGFPPNFSLPCALGGSKKDFAILLHRYSKDLQRIGKRANPINGRVPFGDGLVTHHSISEERNLFTIAIAHTKIDQVVFREP